MKSSQSSQSSQSGQSGRGYWWAAACNDHGLSDDLNDDTKAGKGGDILTGGRREKLSATFDK